MQNSTAYPYKPETDDLANHFDLIEARQLEYTKPILIIYNGNSGIKRNIREVIKSELQSANIPFEFYETTGHGDSFKKANTFDIDGYSAVAAVGGDGTLFDVVNGMLTRSDKKKIPSVHIPNGSGNAYAMNFSITSVERALAAIKKGHVVKADSIKVLIDYESEEAVRAAGADIHKHVCYAELVVSIGFMNQAAKMTTPLMKQILGPFAYFLSVYRLIQNPILTKLDIDIDNGRKVYKDYEGSIIGCYNIFHSLGGITYNPVTLCNDGLAELKMMDKPFTSIK